MKLPELIIGDLKARKPIIQGGMGIGVSLHKLASAVANAGGIGVISAAQVGFKEPDFLKNNFEANVRALKKEIQLARELAPNGVLGVNLMVATNNYNDFVKASVEAGIDLIISGAGLPLDLPKLVAGSNVKIAPIVSSGKAASLICKTWDKKYNRIPDLVIVEGPKAGGHLGFHKEHIEDTSYAIDGIVVDVINAVKPFSEKYNKHIPVVAAGGIFDGHDIARIMNLGADGVQMGTRFVATFECDADEKYKQAYIDAKKEDIQIVTSPVGMPGRALTNKFIKKVYSTPDKVRCYYNCLKPCDPKTAPYCISTALINAVEGNLDEGLIFCGSNVYRIDKIISVKDLIEELVTQAEEKYKEV
ncbi:nitronate monooxygenase [Clostridium homopropionicum DSM 5847]|uniref:Probable nitronate monooxygenase n=1 Tax=Clostridium homopropionicum DSM 5847 TaxID=1121318 RepID=A0A0L6Z7R0_9CLOT|nr:nitronate monooxygenase family protein [Clostridium homopropionicum]KOA18833.1 nitronate monooxygenase [Clostridium homopropionicum DSM 5847]SFG89822.1 NAD(P)H-dependent flavin oxidoreductase YrpB, nitropropane dioxygenase family [Clostridium homopropionicum]